MSLVNLENKRNLVGAEIGVNFGINARDILERFDIKRLYLIDPYTPYMDGKILRERSFEHEAKKYLKDFENKITWIKDYSWNAVFKVPELDFVYIDGDHSYPAVRTDMDLYYPKVKIGGLFAGHDYGERYEGVTRAVDEFFSINNEELQTGSGTDWWCIKKGG